jgi:K+/H+ antiporter YhaU regulatory subunit KhtT
LTETFALNEYLTEIVILPEAASVGQKIKNAAIVKDLDISILEIRREDEIIHQPGPEVVLLAGRYFACPVRFGKNPGDAGARRHKA